MKRTPSSELRIWRFDCCHTAVKPGISVAANRRPSRRLRITLYTCLLRLPRLMQQQDASCMACRRRWWWWWWCSLPDSRYMHRYPKIPFVPIIRRDFYPVNARGPALPENPQISSLSHRSLELSSSFVPIFCYIFPRFSHGFRRYSLFLSSLFPSPLFSVLSSLLSLSIPSVSSGLSNINLNLWGRSLSKWKCWVTDASRVKHNMRSFAELRSFIHWSLQPGQLFPLTFAVLELELFHER